MKLIKMVLGTYGYRAEGDTAVYTKDKDSAPFSLDDKKADRLIELGYAVEVTDQPEATEEKAETSEMMEANLDPEQLNTWKFKDLQKLAKEMGLAAGGTREEIIERICAEKVEVPVDEKETEEEQDAEVTEADEEPPVLTAAEPQ